MSVAYEPRSFIHEGAYPSIGDDPDPDPDVAEQRYTDSDVAEHLGHYAAEASILNQEREVLAQDGAIIPDDDDADRLGLDSSTFASPIQVPLATPLMAEEAPLEPNDLSPGPGSPSSVPRGKQVAKPGRDVTKQADGKYHCPLPDCKEEVNAFSRKCEWK